MNFKLESALQKLTLIFFWLIFPPLFLVFLFIWKMPKLAIRLILTVIAPLTLIVLFVGLFQLQQYYYYHFERGSRAEIEAKTGLKFPDYTTVEKRHFTFEPGFNGDFSMEYTVKFDTANIQNFYLQIDKKLQEPEKQNSSTIYWSLENDGNYFFNHFDPEDEDDQTLELHIDKKNAQIRISYGQM